jgi:hypothetical protein
MQSFGEIQDMNKLPQIKKSLLLLTSLSLGFLSLPLLNSQPAAAGSRPVEYNCTVTFDKVGDKFDDSGWTGNTDPMGALMAGQTYQVTYFNGNYTTRGFNEGRKAVTNATYRNADISKGEISLWGRVYTYDNSGNVYDPQFGLVGTVRWYSN